MHYWASTIFCHDPLRPFGEIDNHAKGLEISAMSNAFRTTALVCKCFWEKIIMEKNSILILVIIYPLLFVSFLFFSSQNTSKTHSMLHIQTHASSQRTSFHLYNVLYYCQVFLGDSFLFWFRFVWWWRYMSEKNVEEIEVWSWFIIRNKRLYLCKQEEIVVS